MQNEIILTLNNGMASSSVLITLIPILADVFIFSYPIYLIYLYLFAHNTSLSRRQKIRYQATDRQYRYNAISIFFSAL